MHLKCLPRWITSNISVYASFFALHAVRTGVPELSFTKTQPHHWPSILQTANQG